MFHTDLMLLNFHLYSILDANYAYTKRYMPVEIAHRLVQYMHEE